MNKRILFVVLVVFLISCGGDKPLFEKLDWSQSGIEFSNDLTESDDFNILDYLYFYNGGGVSVGDINNDGLVDIYFAGNQVGNKLYLNQGDLQFIDITEDAGVGGISDWHTGTTMVDINSDGYLDIYVCAVVGIKGLMGFNELYLNNGDNTFTESAKKYGLDFEVFSSSASFLDYDLDGDLDLYLLNHAVHTQDSYGSASQRYRRDDQTGDRLLRNENGRFVEVSEEAGIFGGANGYGLGVSILDFNQDGYPDIYVSNDFHEDDYFYVNNQDGTFTESIKKLFSHTSRFSMGVDAADINNDGRSDILSLDMLPDKEKVLKSSLGDEDYNLQRLKIERFGYHYQYSRNMLQINQGDFFQEVALQANVAATDWSWGVLMEDFNNDGHQDIFISNGIPRRPNDLDYIKFVSSDQIRDKINSTKLVDQQAMEMMPSGAAQNFFFKGSEGIAFKDLSKIALPNEATFSNAVAAGDLDNDGDLDLVVNNINSQAGIYINQSQGHFLRVKVSGTPANKLGLGCKAYVHQGGKVQYKELYASKGFQGSSEPTLHFGLASPSVIDSLRIVWPNNYSKILVDLPTDQLVEVDTTNWKLFEPKEEKEAVLFERVPGNLGITFFHQEDRYVDFDRQGLMPYMASDRGPAVAVGDLKGDGQQDVFFGGSKFVSSKVFEQVDQKFTRKQYNGISKDSVREVMGASIADFNNDGLMDLLLGTGGSDFFGEMEPLLNSYLQGSEDGFFATSFPELFTNTSVVLAFDFDQDDDQDVFIGNHTVSADFGATPNSYILENSGGTFEVKQILAPGMVTDAKWEDFNNDDAPELVVVGEWSIPTYYTYEGGEFRKNAFSSAELKGLWQTVDIFDVDKDGDQDVILGNWGTNTKFKASADNPLKMYYGDLDDNGSTETVVAQYLDGVYYPLEPLDNLSKQMVELNKKYRSYAEFAGKSVQEVFGPKLRNATVLEVHELRSGFLRNDGGQYSFVPFDDRLQVAPITSTLAYDFDSDGSSELLLAGNYFGVKPYHGRFGSFPGALVQDENSILEGHKLGLELFGKSVRSSDILSLDGNPYLLVTINSDSAQLYQINETWLGKLP